LGFVCKVVLNGIPDTTEDSTHYMRICTKHFTSFMAQMDYS